MDKDPNLSQTKRKKKWIKLLIEAVSRGRRLASHSYKELASSYKPSASFLVALTLLSSVYVDYRLTTELPTSPERSSFYVVFSSKK